MNILEGLNKEQIEAVTTTEGFVRVIAGAGSGKTRALTTRYAYIHSELGIPTSRILSVTFTNKAANEMKSRISKMIGDNVVSPYIMTFHGFCNRVLREDIDKLGYPLKFKIIDTEDQTSLLKPVYQELGITNRDYSYKKALSGLIGKGCKTGERYIVSDYEKLLVTKSSREIDSFIEMLPNVENKIIMGYLREQKKDYCLDYDDLINFVIYLFKTNKYVREKWQERFDYIQVDEFQDVSMRELELVAILSEKNKNLFVVGDDFQCLVEGTQIKTEKGYKSIEEVKVGDKVLAGIGFSEVKLLEVDGISKKRIEEEIIVIKTESGKVIKGTKNHLGFARIEPDTEAHYVYLMFSRCYGYRIGITSGVRQGEKGIKNGFELRLSQEHGDSLWILKKVNNLKEAIYLENYYSYKYGIPQYVFNIQSCSKLALSDNDIKRLHKELETDKNAKKLLKDLGMFEEYPHHIVQAGNGRHKINFCMFGSSRKSATGFYPHELSTNTMSEDFIGVFKKYLNPNSKQTVKNNRYVNGRKINIDYDSQYDRVLKIEDECKEKDIFVQSNLKARFTNENRYDFTPFSHMIKGMHIPVYEDGVIIEEKITEVSRENYNGYVYDINVPTVRNYIANDIVVHNCIYSFRNSDVRCIVEFKAILESIYGTPCEVKTITMDINYRSTPEILDVSNSLIKHNKNQIEKNLVTPNKSGVRVLHYHAKNVYQEAEWVAKRILSLNRPFADIAILFRNNATSRVIEEKLVSYRIPYEMLSGISFYQRKEVKDVLAVLSLVAFEDNVSFKRIITNNPLRIGKKKLGFLTDFAERRDITLYQALKENCREKMFKSTQGEFLINLVENLRAKQEIMTIVQLMDDIIVAFEYEETYLKSDEQERYENLIELKNSAKHFEYQEGEKVDIVDYLGTLALYSETDKEESVDKVKLMTVHAAKGLEYPVIFVVGMNEGLMPSSRTVTTSDLEEERRIAYVAMTRAEELLFLTDAEGENYDRSMRLPSRFLFNIERDLFNSEGVIDKYLLQLAEDYISSNERRLHPGKKIDLSGYNLKEVDIIKVGDRVNHMVFGEGLVIKEDGEAFLILFDTGQAKGILKNSSKLIK